MVSWKLTYSFQKCVEYWDSRCAYCLNQFEPEELTKDHFIPKSKSGPNSKYNYVPACKSCNNDKCNNHPNKWCDSAQRTHIMRFFNWLLLQEVGDWQKGQISAGALEARYIKYREVRGKVRSKARNTRLLELLTVEKLPKPWVEQVRRAVHREMLTNERVQENDAWRTFDGHHLLH